MGRRVRQLVEPPTPPQRYQVRDAPTTSRWPGCRDQPPPRCHLRTIPTAQSKTMVTINQVLASTVVVWINQPPGELNETVQLPFMQAA